MRQEERWYCPHVKHNRAYGVANKERSIEAHRERAREREREMQRQKAEGWAGTDHVQRDLPYSLSGI
jgi:hypothetical protein